MKNTNALIAMFFCFISMNTIVLGEVVPIPNTSYNLKENFEHNLKLFIGKRVQLILKNGHEVSGTIKNVGEKLVHLESLSGKDFFDALIRLDDISVVEAQFRQIQHLKSVKKNKPEVAEK